MLHTKAEVLKENISVDEGVVDAVVGSTSVIDRMGDLIDQAGWNLNNYSQNPVILWGHNVKEERPPIGKALKVWVEGKQARTKKLMFKVKFDLQDSFAAEIFRKVKDGFVNTVSVGFLPTEWEEMDKDKGPFGGRKYTKQELLELSFVPVPANPEALVTLRSLAAEDKRFEPMELDELFPQVSIKLSKDEVVKPYPNEHSCRLASPDDFQDNSFRRVTRKHDGKDYSVIMAKKKSEDVMSDQAFRYPKDIWATEEAESHCKDHDGTFEPANEESLYDGDMAGTSPSSSVTKVAEDKPVEEEPVEEKPVEDVPSAEPAKEPEPEPKPEPKAEPEAIAKGTIGFKDYGMAPETEAWDGPGEVAKADVKGLKAICAWFDSGSPDNKSSYKLPHHKADGFKCVWRGVAAAMAALLGARGGAQIPDGDRKGVFNHLKKHYVQFEKEAPDFKMVEDQVLAKLEDEVHALTLDREEKHAVRLIKKVLRNQRDDKAGYTSLQVKQALQIINSALSLYKQNS